MRLKPRHAVLAAVLVVIGVIVVVAASSTSVGTREQEGTVISQTLSVAKPNATATFVIALQEGGDAEHESEHIFKSVQSPGIESASLDTQTLSLQVRYDDSVIEESDIRTLLAGAGYLKPTAADATQATLSPDGKTQTLAVRVGEGLDPALIGAKAGVPLTITFGPGTAHLASITIAELGISQDLTKGATIEIKDPRPGTYPIVCAEQVADGTLIVAE